MGLPPSSYVADADHGPGAHSLFFDGLGGVLGGVEPAVVSGGGSIGEKSQDPHHPEFAVRLSPIGTTEAVIVGGGADTGDFVRGT